jgi:streptomycin 6-kinase
MAIANAHQRIPRIADPPVGCTPERIIILCVAVGDDAPLRHPGIPARVLTNWRNWWPQHHEAVAADIAARIPSAVAAWRLTALSAVEHGDVALVLTADSPRGPAVVKFNPRVEVEGGEESRDEARVLESWHGAGAPVPQVWGVRDQDQTILLERIEPGTPLAELCIDPLATMAALGRLARALRGAEVDRSGFTRLADSVRLAGWRRELAGTRELGELDALLADTAQERVLHMDLHNLNVLYRADDGFVVIDPKPLVGDPHAESYGLLQSPQPLSGDRSGDRDHVFGLLEAYRHGLDIDRLSAWTRLRALALYTTAKREQPAWADQLARWIEALDR